MTLPDVVLGYDLRHDLPLSVKEALHNVVKHAKASQVTLSMRLFDGRVEFAIQDNGGGFSSGANASVGNGLRNLRERMRHLLANAAGVEYVGAWPTGETALEGIIATQPRVVLMDIHLPGMSGVECVRRLKPLLPTTEFMMLTVFEEHDLVYESLVAGATGYLVKKTTPEELLRAIRELHEGGSPMSTSIARKVVAALASGPAPAPRREADPLSIREREVLERLSSGMRYKEIAAHFHLSEHTVRTHLHNIYGKLQVHSKAGAIRAFRDNTGLLGG